MRKARLLDGRTIFKSILAELLTASNCQKQHEQNVKVCERKKELTKEWWKPTQEKTAMLLTTQKIKCSYDWVNGEKWYHVLTGKVIKRCKNIMYKVQLENHEENTTRTKKIFAREMATCDIINDRPESAAEKERIKNHRSRFYIPFTMADRTPSFNYQGYSILFNSQGNGNCQYAAVAFAL